MMECLEDGGEGFIYFVEKQMLDVENFQFVGCLINLETGNRVKYTGGILHPPAME